MSQIVDRFTRMVQQGTITPAEARRRRKQSRDTQRGGGPPAPQNNNRIPRSVVANMARQTEVWTEWFSGRRVVQLVPTVATEFPTVATLDHVLVSVQIEVLPLIFDTNLQLSTAAACLWRFTPDQMVDNPNEDGPPQIPVGTEPTGTDVRQYAGSQSMNLLPGGPLVRWVFRPRDGDRTDSLRADMPKLMLVVDTTYLRLRPPTGDVINALSTGASFRVGVTYRVKDRQGLLL